MALKKIPRKRYSLGSCGSYTYQCRIVHRDNKDTYNAKGGGDSGYRMRIPSLKRPLATWKRFYKLYPKVLECLKECAYPYHNQIVNGDVIIVRNKRIHADCERIKTLKFKKIW